MDFEAFVAVPNLLCALAEAFDLDLYARGNSLYLLRRLIIAIQC